VEFRFGFRIREVGYEGDVVAFHDSLELLSDVIGLDEVTFREVVLPRPVIFLDIYRGFSIRKTLEDIEDGERGYSVGTGYTH